MLAYEIAKIASDRNVAVGFVIGSLLAAVGHVAGFARVQIKAADSKGRGGHFVPVMSPTVLVGGPGGLPEICRHLEHTILNQWLTFTVLFRLCSTGSGKTPAMEVPSDIVQSLEQLDAEYHAKHPPRASKKKGGADSDTDLTDEATMSFPPGERVICRE
jgi:hypothetical protein